MKKLIVLLFAVLLSAAAYSQSITDKGSYVKIIYQDGTRVSIGKSQVESLRPHNGRIYFMTSRTWSNDDVTRIVNVRPSEFGFSNIDVFWDYLNQMFFGSYGEAFSYDATGAIDTISYYIGDSLAYRIPLTIDVNGKTTFKGEPINE